MICYDILLFSFVLPAITFHQFLIMNFTVKYSRLIIRTCSRCLYALFLDNYPSSVAVSSDAEGGQDERQFRNRIEKLLMQSQIKVWTAFLPSLEPIQIHLSSHADSAASQFLTEYYRRLNM